MDDYLSFKGMSKGENSTKDGSRYYVAVATDALNAESVEEFENAAESLKISGIGTIKNWDCKHPRSHPRDELRFDG